MNTVLLMKNGSLKLKKDIMKYYDDIEYILFSADPVSSTFVLHRPMKYMKNFTRANIYIETYVRKVVNDIDSYQFQEDYAFTKMGSTIKELNTLEEFVQYMASLSRITFTNKLVKSNDCLSYELIEFSFFRIEIFYDNQIIYKKELNLKNQKGYFDTRTILENISIIYDTEVMSAKYLNISLSTNEWSIDVKPKKDHLCGAYLIYTRSFLFLNFDDLSDIRRTIKSLYIKTFTYNKEEDLFDSHEGWEYIDISNINDYSYKILPLSCHFYDLWVHEDVFILEFIAYLPYTYMTIQTISEINDCGNPNGKYESESHIEIEFFDHHIPEKHIVSTTDRPVSIHNLVEIIREGEKLCI